MACRVKHSREINVVFEGLIQSSIRAKLTVELLKYLVHQRGQIPVSYELVKRDFEQDLLISTDQNVPKSRMAGRAKLESLKRRKAITALEQIFETLEEVFSQMDPIPEVLISLGPTLVSPKEIYRLRFPTKCYDGKVLDWTKCRMTLFQTLVSVDVFGTAKPCKPGMKISVLLRALGHSAASSIGLNVKPTYKVSHRGDEYIFNFVCKGREINPEISHLDASFNMSGIEPFDQDSPMHHHPGGPIMTVSSNTTPVSCHRRKAPVGNLFPSLQRKMSKLDSVEESPSVGGGSGMVCETDEGQDTESGMIPSPIRPTMEIDDVMSRCAALNMEEKDPEFMWFQIPVSMAGYRDRTSK